MLRFIFKLLNVLQLHDKKIVKWNQAGNKEKQGLLAISQVISNTENNLEITICEKSEKSDAKPDRNVRITKSGGYNDRADLNEI